MNVIINSLLVLIFLGTLLTAFAGLSYLAYRCFSVQSDATSNDHVEKIRRQWLYSFSSIVTLLGILCLIVLCYDINNGLAAEEIGRRTGYFSFFATLYFVLPYYLGYCKRGDKYLFGIAIIQIINIIGSGQQAILFSIIGVVGIVQAFTTDSIASVINYGLTSIAIVLAIAGVTTYVINNFRLSQANRRHKKIKQKTAAEQLSAFVSKSE